jgi:tetratricopeptide (TPR) repeat protein
MSIPDERSSLEAERDYLLRSLDDLDNERAAGNIDDATYERLHADYTARAAIVLRRLRDGLDIPMPAAPKPNGARRWLPIAVVLVFAAGVALFLVQSVSDREPGGSVTGNSPTREPAVRTESLAQAVERRPDDYNARIAYARSLLAENPQEAVVQYGEAAKLDPTQPEPLAYGAYISALVAGQLDRGDERRQLLIDRALERFDRAIEVGPEYEDTYVFRGITRMQVIGDTEGAISDYRRFLQLAPQDHPQRERVLAALARAVESSSSTTQP